MSKPSIIVDSQTQNIPGFLYQRAEDADRAGYRQVPTGLAPAQPQSVYTCPSEAPKQIFLLEDSDDDVEAFERVIRGHFRDFVVTRASSVAEARGLLWGASPDLITLDLHLAGESSLDLLRDIRSHHRLMRTPVVMMSDTENDDEIHAAYLLGANSFLKKPFSCERYSDSVSLMLTYWLEMNYSSPTCRPERVVNGTFELAQRECHHTGLAWSVVLQANDL